MDLTSLLEPNIDIPRLSEVLEGLGHEGRVHCIRGWSNRTMSGVYDALAGHIKPTLEHLVPSGAALQETVHIGQNSLPLFSHFQKRFVRTEDGAIVGYNHNPSWQMAATGPGYFVAKLNEDQSELVFDYTVDVTPPLAIWPKFLSNRAPRSMLVFGGLIDFVRPLTNHVLVGRATRNGKPFNAHFVLVRRD